MCVFKVGVKNLRVCSFGNLLVLPKTTGKRISWLTRSLFESTSAWFTDPRALNRIPESGPRAVLLWQGIGH